VAKSFLVIDLAQPKHNQARDVFTDFFKGALWRKVENMQKNTYLDDEKSLFSLDFVLLSICYKSCVDMFIFSFIYIK
jgi:hypothetical protein